MTIDAFWVTALVSVIIPVLVGLLTKATAATWIQDVTNMVLTGIVALVATATQIDGVAVISWVTFREWVVALAISIAMYLKVWKPVDINQRTLPAIGLGAAA
jgi:hypothetical protein